MNKKGAMGPAPSFLDWMGFIAVIVIIILATIIFSIKSAQIENKINNMPISQEENYLFLNILRTPLDNSDAENIGELISLWYADEKYEWKLKNSISKVLDKYYNKDVSWKLTAGDKSIGDGKGSFEIINYIPLHYSPNDKIIEVKISIAS